MPGIELIQGLDRTESRDTGQRQVHALVLKAHTPGIFPSASPHTWDLALQEPPSRLVPGVLEGYAERLGLSPGFEERLLKPGRRSGEGRGGEYMVIGLANGVNDWLYH